VSLRAGGKNSNRFPDLDIVIFSWIKIVPGIFSDKKMTGLFAK
jgi:hypothetical protein